MKTAVVTGASSGIGYAVCEALIKRDYFVIGVGRNEQKCLAARNEIIENHPGAQIDFITADLLSQREVLRSAKEILKILDRTSDGALYALINNAGCVRGCYTTTEEGYEQQFALNHLAGFLLTHELFPNLVKGKGRILFTSSNSHKMTKMNWSDLMFQKRYNPLFAYKQSKLCNLLTVYWLNAKYGASGIRAYGIDPGLVRTDIGNKDAGVLIDLFWSLRKAKGADPSVPAAAYLKLLESAPPLGELYHGCDKPHRYSREVNEKNAGRLFELSERLCGITGGWGI
ncbi:MAG: Glucose 1-dehydrogenase 4 [Firmicutes bacterium ADurb.Bin182]|nr:MAG: Glucose 1-dehydrogenase 4 [Firmicutes bacterium ADurb.Bin182]